MSKKENCISKECRYCTGEQERGREDVCVREREEGEADRD